MIRKAREINDSMARFVASKLIKAMIKKGQLIKGAKVLVMGVAFKENCPDIRNTKVIDLIKELESYGMNIDAYDPWVDQDEASCEYSINMINSIAEREYDAVIVAVAHSEFIEMGDDIYKVGKEVATYLDMKNSLKGLSKEMVKL